MKSTLFNFGDGLSNRENFFLMKVLQKYWAYESRGEENPFAYISYSEKESILGKNPNQKIQKLIQSECISEIEIGQTAYKNKINGLIPLKKTYTIKNVDENYIDNYYLKKQVELSELHYSVFKSVSKAKISIDNSEWRKFVQQAHSTLKSNGSDKSRRRFKSEMNIIYEQIRFWNRCSLREKHDLVSVDDFGNRFHSIFSRIPKEVRKNYVTILGESTVEIDLAQSQPTILSVILKDKMGKNSFTDAINNGEYVYDLLGKTTKEGKMEFNYSMFGRKINRSFKKAFPDTIKAIQELKYNSPKGFKPHAGLAMRLQQKESEMFSSIWSKLISRRISFIPVHDSIIVRSKDYSLAMYIMEKELTKHLPVFTLR